MKNGQIVELKDGTSGLKIPYNLAVFLGRSKKKKKEVIFTIQGKKYVKKSDITRRLGKNYVMEDNVLGDSLKMKEKLLDIIGRGNTKGKDRADGKRKDSRSGPGRNKIHKIDSGNIISRDISVSSIWLEVRDKSKKMTLREIAELNFGKKGCSSAKIEKVRNVIDDSIEEGYAFFNKIGKKGIYRVLSEKDFITLKRTIRTLLDISKILEDYKFSKCRENHPNKDPNRMNTSLIIESMLTGLEDGECQSLNGEKKGKDNKHLIRRIFSDEERTMLMLKMCSFMEDFILNDRWGRGLSLSNDPDIRITKTENFDIRTYLIRLAESITGIEKGTHTTVFTLFLLAVGYWTLEKSRNIYIARMIKTGQFTFSKHYPKVYSSRSLKAMQDLEYTFAGNINGEHEDAGNEDKRMDGRLERKDLRQMTAYTIDPKDAKDFDDAISIEKDGENTVLFVHIADVSHYVIKDDPLDKEAGKRCTSVYLPDTVLPMLPEVLSNDLCSLKEKVDRFAMTTRMIFDKKGIMLDFDLFPSVITVTRNLCYEDVLEGFRRNEQPFREWIEFSRLLRAKRNQLEIETSELRLSARGNKVTREFKRPNPATEMIETFMVTTNEVIATFLTAFFRYIPYRAHGMPDISRLVNFNSIARHNRLNIELFNENVIDRARKKKMEVDMGFGGMGDIRIKVKGKMDPALLKSLGIHEENNELSDPEQRVSDKMNLKDIDHLKHAVMERDMKEIKKALRGRIEGYIEVEKRDRIIRDLNRVLKSINKSSLENKLKEILNISILKCLDLAVYSSQNIGHFGLGSDCYLHFTSPIRRYPDLIAHRLLKDVLWLLNNDFKKDLGLQYSEKEIDDICLLCSERSREAESFEYSIKDIINCIHSIMDTKFMNGKHVGYVNGIIPRGIFVTLEEGMEGFILMKSLSSKRTHISEDETKVIVTGSRLQNNKGFYKDLVKKNRNDNIILGIGNKVLLRPTKFCIEKGNFDFELLSTIN